MRTPKGKINLVMNFSKVISTMLGKTQKGSMADGADVTFPCVIYALLKLTKYEEESAKSSELLKSNMTYMRMFRHENLLHG